MQVGSDAEAAPSTYSKVKEFLAANAAHCSVVKAHWLRECALRRETLPSDARFSLDASDLTILSRGVRTGHNAGKRYSLHSCTHMTSCFKPQHADIYVEEIGRSVQLEHAIAACASVLLTVQ